MNGYFLIKDLDLVAKIEDFVPYIYYPERGWEVDNANLLMDRLMGYEDGSMGNSNIFQVEEITEAEALKQIS